MDNSELIAKLKNELFELKTKIDRLDDFIYCVNHNDFYQKLDDEDREMLLQQLSYMEQYSFVLIKRIIKIKQRS